MNAREQVLLQIRTAVTGSARQPVERNYRIADDAPGSIALLKERLLDYRARVHDTSADDLALLLAHLTQGERVVLPPGLPTQWTTALDGGVVDDGHLTPVDLDGLDAVVTSCVVAVAETGTIVLDGGPGQGRRALSLVPDHHVVIVRNDQVVATVPQALTRLDARRPQTWISGPSATSDIELERVEGVHGPRRLDVVLVN